MESSRSAAAPLLLLLLLLRRSDVLRLRGALRLHVHDGERALRRRPSRRALPDGVEQAEPQSRQAGLQTSKVGFLEC